MKIGTREIGNGNPTFIIAEAGTAYLRDNRSELRHMAWEFLMSAHKAGADAVKFQLFVPNEPLFCPLPGDENRRGRWERCARMSFEDWAGTKEECDDIGITFLASAFQPTAVQWLKDLNVAAYKVASRAADTYPYDAVPGPFIISDGMSWWFHRPKNHIRLQCRSVYPTPLDMAAWHLLDGGLSDHSGTIWPGLDAMARGCPMLEVHFAIDKADAGNDAQVCLSVDQLKLLCEARDAFAALRTPAR